VQSRQISRQLAPYRGVSYFFAALKTTAMGKYAIASKDNNRVLI